MLYVSMDARKFQEKFDEVIDNGSYDGKVIIKVDDEFKVDMSVFDYFEGSEFFTTPEDMSVEECARMVSNLVESI